MLEPHRDDVYAVLGVAPSATDREIAAAYRRLVRELHPDVPGGDAEAFAAVVAAFEVLRDPQRRAEVDRRRAPARDHGTPVPVTVHVHRTRAVRRPDLRAGPVRYHPSPRRPFR